MDGALAHRQNTAREQVTVFLGFLTAEACWMACREHLPHENLAAVLCRLWFDEIYVPGERYLDSLKGDRTQAAVDGFWACFTAAERAVLERFHGCLELRLDLAINRAHGRAFFPDNDSWRSILRDARAVLAELDPDPERLQALLAALVARITHTPDGLQAAWSAQGTLPPPAPAGG